jgi:hypothetical protein
MRFFLEEEYKVIAKYSSISEAINAKNAMHGSVIGGHVMEVSIVYDQERSTATVIPELVSEDDVDENDGRPKKKEIPFSAAPKKTPMIETHPQTFIRNNKTYNKDANCNA